MGNSLSVKANGSFDSIPSEEEGENNTFTVGDTVIDTVTVDVRIKDEIPQTPLNYQVDIRQTGVNTPDTVLLTEGADESNLGGLTSWLQTHRATFVLYGSDKARSANSPWQFFRASATIDEKGFTYGATLPIPVAWTDIDKDKFFIDGSFEANGEIIRPTLKFGVQLGKPSYLLLNGSGTMIAPWAEGANYEESFGAGLAGSSVNATGSFFGDFDTDEDKSGVTLGVTGNVAGDQIGIEESSVLKGSVEFRLTSASTAKDAAFGKNYNSPFHYLAVGFNGSVYNTYSTADYVGMGNPYQDYQGL